MEGHYVTHTSFPSVGKTNNRCHIPIRSITYKKAVTEAAEQENRQIVMKTLQNFYKPEDNNQEYTLHRRGVGTFRSNPDISSLNPFMSCTLHKLNVGSPKIPTSPQATSKGHSALLPSIRSPTKPTGSQSVRSESLGPKSLTRQLTKGLKEIPEVTAQEDYFKLLVDKNRKTFKVEDCEGVDQYYTDEMIMSRIHKHGFRDSQYYGTKTSHTEMTVPDEATIRQDYRFKIPPVVSVMENTSTLATHVLGGAINNVGFVELAIESAQQQMDIIKDEKTQLEHDIESIKKRFEKEVKDLEADFLKRFDQLQSVIKEDFISNQNENFKNQKSNEAHWLTISSKRISWT